MINSFLSVEQTFFQREIRRFKLGSQKIMKSIPLNVNTFKNKSTMKKTFRKKLINIHPKNNNHNYT